jgi:hypothetical protein
MKTVMRLTIITAAFALGSIFGPPAARASGDAPWCAITEVGDGDGQWDCQYETVQECRAERARRQSRSLQSEPLLFTPSGYCLCSGQESDKHDIWRG